MAASGQAIEAQLAAASAACAASGTKLTPLRRAVLELILAADGPLTAYQLLDRLRATRQGAVPPTIYRALDFLLGQKLIHRVESLNAFISCNAAGHHAHDVQLLICRHCGAVAEVEDAAVAHALHLVAEVHGFHPGSVVVEMKGTCAACTPPP